MTSDAVDSQTIEVHGLGTPYLRAGRKGAPTVVLLHDGAFGSDARSCWGSVIPLLAGEYEVIAPDLLGHGGSPKVFHFDMDPLSQRLRHVQAFCGALGLEDAAFVGSSFGGGLVLQGAVRRALPMRAGVSICGPGGVHMVGAQFAALQDYEPSEAAARGILEKMAVRVDESEVRRRYEATLVPGHWEALAAARIKNPARTDESPDWRPRYLEALSGITIPILLVAGGDDPLLEEGWEKDMAARMPRGESVRIEGTRHMPHADRPAEVADVVHDFLQRTR
jgi:pimeloyl-ACP methyl ester carboxylesterase